MVFAKLKSRQSTDQAVSLILDDLPKQVRPPRCAGPPVSMHLLTGDNWAPALCALVQAAQRRIEIAAYSVSTRWPKLASNKFNLYRQLLDAPARGLACTCILAEHKRTAATARFNFWSARQLADHGWTVRRAPRGRLLHAKLFIFDRATVCLGSHNVAHAASATNLDLSVCIAGPDAVAPFLNWYADIWKRAA